MVPLTSKAFMRGHLVHTNELLVLLGDNWFMEASAKRAAEVASRRLRECDNILEKVTDRSLYKNDNPILNWKQFKLTADTDKHNMNRTLVGG